jgi:NADH-quinone oxidoreductase subunit B
MTLQKKIDGQHLTGEGRPRHLDRQRRASFRCRSKASTILEPTSNPGVWPVPVVIR